MFARFVPSPFCTWLMSDTCQCFDSMRRIIVSERDNPSLTFKQITDDKWLAIPKVLAAPVSAGTLAKYFGLYISTSESVGAKMHGITVICNRAVAIRNVPALIGAKAMSHENRGRPLLHPGSLVFAVGPGAMMRAARTCADSRPLLRATCSYQDGARTQN